MTEFHFILAFASKRKKLDGFAGLPKFQWEDLVGQDVIGQGTFGAARVFGVFKLKESPQKMLL